MSNISVLLDLAFSFPEYELEEDQVSKSFGIRKAAVFPDPPGPFLITFAKYADLSFLKSPDNLSFQLSGTGIKIRVTCSSTIVYNAAIAKFYILGHSCCSGGGGGGGNATASNQETQIDLLEEIRDTLNDGIDVNGSFLDKEKGGLTVTSISVNTVSSVKLVANPNRKYLECLNRGPVRCFINYNAAATTNSRPLEVNERYIFETNFIPTSAIQAITSAGTTTLILTEG